MDHDVFISHSSKDKAVADAVLAALESAGIQCWIAPRNVPPGPDYGEGIINGIIRSKGMVLILSSNANRSTHVKREVERAISHGKFLIPFRIEHVTPSGSMEYFASAPHWLDALTLPLEPHLGRLVKAVQELLAGNGPGGAAGPPARAAKTLRVVLVYRRSTEPDGTVLSMLEAALKMAGHSVFIDRHLKIGVEWARQIELEIRSADAVIPLLSAASVQSEMMAYEVRTAGEAAENGGKPRILPVRLAFEDKLPAELAAVLDRLQYFLWNGAADDRRLLEELLPALVNPPKPVQIDRAKLEPAGGAVPLDARFYVVRPVDDEAASAVARHDSIILIKGARQMGKTSLMARAAKLARDSGMRVLRTDYQKLTAAQFKTLDGFYQAVAQELADQLAMEVSPEQDWRPTHSANRNFETFVRRRVLADPAVTVLWAMDEVDRLFSCDFSGDVFGLLRTWHNDRAIDPDGPWSRLTMGIAYATEAHLFITDLNQSPFNVGTRFVLEDFTVEQVADLDRRHGSPSGDPRSVAAFHQLTGGQPYLVRRGLNEIVSRGVSSAEFSQRADRDDGPYGDHLRRMLVLLARDETMLQIVRDLLRGTPCTDADRFFRLRSGGVVAGDAREECRLRCGVYAMYLSRHLL